MADPNAGAQDIYEKTLAEETPDICMESLKSNWDGILVAAILEIV